MDEIAKVPVKSAWASKINWAQILAATASVGVLFGIDISPEAQVKIIEGILATTAVVTVILRTYFNGSVTDQSLPK